MKYDLHVHSKDSDGKYSRLEILRRAVQDNLKYLCFTDHDFISDVPVKEDYEKLYGQCCTDLIQGVELTISDYNAMHLLCYDPKNIAEIRRRLQELEQLNVERCKRMVNKLNDYYHFELDFNEYPGFKICNGLIRRMIADKGYAKSIADAGKLYVGPHARFYESKSVLSLKEAMALIKAADGIAILAHPSTLGLDDDSLDEFVQYLIELGLAGIEVLNTSKTTAAQEKYYCYLAEKYKLLMSCGSDYHDELQTLGINNDKSNQLIKLIKER